MSACAHDASIALLSLVGIDLRNKWPTKCSVCKHPLRAHEVGKWASQYTSVTNCTQTNTYLIYQVRDTDNQGHVYVYSNGKYYGNGNYDWIHTS
jgi:hypothetical protein